MLETLLFPMENYHEESFGGPKRKLSVKEKRGDRETIVRKAEGCKEEDSSPNSAPTQERPPETATEERENTTPVKTTQERAPVVVFAKVGNPLLSE